MRELYQKIEQVINQVNFHEIWEGFHAYPFVLYNDSTIYFKDDEIPYDNRFVGNTSIEFNGEYIAIWKVESIENLDIDILAALIVHEMFHAFQKEHKESRFPNDLKLLSYPVKLENLVLKQEELKVLAAAYKENEAKEKLRYMEKFSVLRKGRKEIIGDVISMEFQCETIEGIAEYCGCMALKQMNKEKFDTYISDDLNRLEQEVELLFDPRRCAYYSGAVFYLLLRQVGISFYHELAGCQETVYEMVDRRIDNNIHKTINEIFGNELHNTLDKNQCNKLSEQLGNELVHNDKLVEEKLRSAVLHYDKEKKQKFDNFFQTERNRIAHDCFICGYDPMNMLRLENQILCSHFIMLCDLKTEDRMFVKGPILVELVEGTHNIVNGYYV